MPKHRCGNVHTKKSIRSKFFELKKNQFAITHINILISSYPIFMRFFKIRQDQKLQVKVLDLTKFHKVSKSKYFFKAQQNNKLLSTKRLDKAIYPWLLGNLLNWHNKWRIYCGTFWIDTTNGLIWTAKRINKIFMSINLVIIMFSFFLSMGFSQNYDPKF